MKKFILSLMALSLGLSATAQDDVYFVPTKKAVQQERQAKRQAQQKAAQTAYESSYSEIETSDYDQWADNRQGTMDVDAYNRRGRNYLVPGTAEADSVNAGYDVAAMADYSAADKRGQVEEYITDIYLSPTDRLVRFHTNYGNIINSRWYSNLFELAYYDPWYYRHRPAWFYDAYYPSVWGWVGYDPYWSYSSLGWYSGWGYSMPWGWGHAYYQPWNPWFYGGYGWHTHYPYYHGHAPIYGHATHHYATTGRTGGSMSGHNFSRGGAGSTARGFSSVNSDRTTLATRGGTSVSRGGASAGTRSYSGRNTTSLNNRYSGSSSRTTSSSAGTRTFSRNGGSASSSSNGSSYSGSNSSSRYSSGSNSSYSGSSSSSSSYSDSSRGGSGYVGNISRGGGGYSGGGGGYSGGGGGGGSRSFGGGGGGRR